MWCAQQTEYGAQLRGQRHGGGEAVGWRTRRYRIHGGAVKRLGIDQILHPQCNQFVWIHFHYHFVAPAIVVVVTERRVYTQKLPPNGDLCLMGCFYFLFVLLYIFVILLLLLYFTFISYTLNTHAYTHTHTSFVTNVLCYNCTGACESFRFPPLLYR